MIIIIQHFSQTASVLDFIASPRERYVHRVKIGKDFSARFPGVFHQ